MHVNLQVVTLADVCQPEEASSVFHDVLYIILNSEILKYANEPLLITEQNVKR